jgi:glucose-1-phosphatase
MIYQGQHIDSVIFDLGGVILNIDYQLPVKAFQRLGLTDFNLRFSQTNQQNLFNDYETGIIGSDVFVDAIRELLPPSTSTAQIIDAWNSILLDLPEQRLLLLEKTAENHRIFLLSNTNELHIQSFHKYLQHSFQIENLGKLFEKVYYSFQIGLRKPSQAVFNFVLSDAGIDPTKTLFIDDSIQHILAARECGILSHHLDKEDLVDFLSDKL